MTRAPDDHAGRRRGRGRRPREGAMLVDAAKGGDVEIPVFCYEPKLGGPVGACRMCLVEVEGIPKLQTACSTPVRDGMVVYTRTDRVIEAQSAVVEFLLVNHPLDCPVCDKGGECPLQDIAMGWGPGRSRVTDPKRHFRKPMPLSPLVRIDRERCILCYRCVRFSQEVAEDEQLQLLERGASSYVGTFDDRPYIAPFHGNIIELCPVGALTSEAYRFRARPWDIEDSGSICTLCPSQCNVKFTVRDERVAAGAGPRQPRGRRRLALRQGPLRLPDDRLRASGSPSRRVGRLAGRLGGGARGGRRAPARGGRAHRRDRRRPGLERGGLPGPADRPRGARLGRRRPRVDELGARAALGRSRRPSSAPRSPTSTTPSRSSSSASTRCTRCRSSTCGCARRSASGDAAAGGRLRAPDRARRRRRGDRPLRARRRRGLPRRARGRAQRRPGAGERRTPARAPRGSPASCGPARRWSSRASGSGAGRDGAAALTALRRLRRQLDARPPARA